MQREHLGSRLGFILLSAGCAIGCGNVWKFPWMAGQYGGGGFVLVYALCLLVLGLPVMVMEFSLGRAAQASPVKMYQKLQKPGQKWHIHGYLALLGNICLMSFYTVVSGWMIYYFYKFLVGQHVGLGFVGMIILSLIDFERFPWLWLPMAVFNVLFQLSLYFIGKEVGGNKSWIELPGGLNIQPGEIGKIIFI